MRPRPRYDRFRDAKGVHIPVGVHPGRGALSSRFGKAAKVVAYGRSRLQVRFDEDQVINTIRPHLVQLLPNLTRRADPRAARAHGAVLHTLRLEMTIFDVPA